MIRAWTVDAVRRAEAAALAIAPEGALMQRAAGALAARTAVLLRQRCGGVAGRRVVLLVGAGDNGGDALWAGVRLARRGARVDAVPAAGRVHAEGLAELRAAGGRTVAVDEATAVLARADVVLDGLVGLGGSPGLRPPADALVAAVPPTAAVVAVDLPSGVDPDTGQTPGEHVRADVTVTFGGAKPCLLLPPAAAAAGRVEVVDIGLDPAELGPPQVERLEPADAAGRWPVPGPRDDKYSRGVLGVVAGGARYTGAAVLCTGAAVRAGAGMVRYLGPPEPTALVRARWPEVVPGQGRVQAWVVGPGIDPGDPDQLPAVEAALAGDLPCLVDAGALELLPAQRRDAPTLLTPHAGELARLLTRLEGDGAGRRAGTTARDDVLAAPLDAARRAARLTGATVLLKGATTLVVPPDGPVRSQPAGPPWLATAGAGDVLAGVAGVLLAAGLDPVEAGSLAVLAHAAAARAAAGTDDTRVGGPLAAGLLLDALPAAVARLLGGE
ncbi:NAD(P)H-hydrate epimerase [Kineosporiaceae bacterium SCSIO 59966]|nr:NAD(P)H-hydrate epimerase [Kineosporiaceae bacterium SCSIO 59966]